MLIPLADWQPLWERLHLWTLFWMNHGAGGDCRKGGEEWVLAHAVQSMGLNRPVLFDVGANQGGDMPLGPALSAKRDGLLF